jgi:hypothetical protein
MSQKTIKDGSFKYSRLIARNHLLNIKSGEHAVLITLADRADEKGTCWPSQELIAMDSHMTTSAVSDNIKKLKQKEFVTVTRKYNGNRPYNIYHLNIPLIQNRFNESEADKERLKNEKFSELDSSNDNPFLVDDGSELLTSELLPSDSISKQPVKNDITKSLIHIEREQEKKTKKENTLRAGGDKSPSESSFSFNSLSDDVKELSQMLFDGLVNEGHYIMGSFKSKSWAEPIRKLRETDKVNYFELKETIEAVINNTDDQYCPVVRSGRALREKYGQLQDYKKRSIANNSGSSYSIPTNEGTLKELQKQVTGLYKTSPFKLYKKLLKGKTDRPVFEDSDTQEVKDAKVRRTLDIMNICTMYGLRLIKTHKETFMGSPIYKYDKHASSELSIIKAGEYDVFG